MRVLLLDPDAAASGALVAALTGIDLCAVSSQGEGLRAVAAGGWDLLLIDSRFCGAELEVLARLTAPGGAGVPVVVVTLEPSVRLTLAAIRRGAHDVLEKPLSPGRVREIAAALRPSARVRPLEEGISAVDALIGSSPVMLTAFRTVARTADSDATVLLLGESGTGKEMVARVLHEQSSRASRPFVAINCAAIPEHLLESELFGHEKGSFTGAIGQRIGRFERASGGTLFLDEIGDMSLGLQSKILRALQEREIERVGGSGTVPIDVRVVAATHRDLAAAVRAERFRQDLYYRLAVVELYLPPLRSRGRDIDDLCQHFVARYAAQYRRPVRGIAEETFELLRRLPWPGNVRQLRNVLERAVLMSDGAVLLPEHLPRDLFQDRDRPPLDGEDEGPLCTLAEMERRMIRRALRETGGRLAAAAELLGVHRNTLRRKMAEYGIGDPD